MRFPLPSARVVKNDIEPNLKKVLYSANATFDYDVTNVDKNEINKLLDGNSFADELFNKLLYRHNDILIDDTNSEGEAYRWFLPIDKVISIKTNKNKITQIAFHGKAVIDNVDVNGIVYIDDQVYSLYVDNKLVKEVTHDLKVCPANFISLGNMGDSYIVKESIYSYVREELEEFVFLKTLQKVTEPNGAFPILTMLDIDSEEDEEDDSYDVEVMAASVRNTSSQGTLQAGSVIKTPIRTDVNDKVDTDIVQNLMKMHYIPTDVLNTITERIANIKASIVTTIVGDLTSANASAKNETQVELGVVTLENRLSGLSSQLNAICTSSAKNLLNIAYPDRVNNVFIHFGTDFYLETVAQMMHDFEFAPNPVERRDALTRMNQSKYKNNSGKRAKQQLLYDLMPYATDVDFNKAVELELVSPENKSLYLRFTHWIAIFNENIGDLSEYYSIFEDKQEAIKEIRQILINLVKENEYSNNSSQAGFGEGQTGDSKV
ncbi:MAG: hypothetical protein HRS51_02885 [Candidatus Nitrosopelagicus sp.]|nr:hypothetical protein [Candidatus Nitrosopelagicus sp.]